LIEIKQAAFSESFLRDVNNFDYFNYLADSSLASVCFVMGKDPFIKSQSPVFNVSLIK